MSTQESKNSQSTNQLAFYSDTPPLIENGHGNHGIAAYFIQVLSNQLGLIITRKYRRSIKRQSIKAACSSVALDMHPDVSALGIRRFFPTVAAILDIIVFMAWSPLLIIKLHRRNIKQLFVLCGADSWFLINILWLQLLKVRVEIYLVDDIEASSAYGHNMLLRGWVRPLLASVIRRSEKVYAISEGFVEHLDQRFGCQSIWLPLPSITPPPQPDLFTPCTAARRHIVFIGGLNHLYVDTLRELYEEICAFNETKFHVYQLVLEIMSYGDTEAFIKSLPNRDWVIAYHQLKDRELQEHLSRAYACFLPYSFLPEEALMVSTSFSCKILEYYACGKPILVYGPAYASIPRFFRKELLALCANSRVELKAALVDLDSMQTQAHIVRYGEVWRKYHSPEAIRKILLR